MNINILFQIPNDSGNNFQTNGDRNVQQHSAYPRSTYALRPCERPWWSRNRSRNSTRRIRSGAHRPRDRRRLSDSRTRPYKMSTRRGRRAGAGHRPGHCRNACHRVRRWPWLRTKKVGGVPSDAHLPSKLRTHFYNAHKVFENVCAIYFPFLFYNSFKMDSGTQRCLLYLRTAILIA